METSNLTTTARGMWDTRPLRARSAPIAGVCTGFARRYQVDVALVRAAFIGATVLGGLGLVAYIAAVFVLPRESEPWYGTRVQQSGPPAFVLIVAAVIAVMFGSGISASWPGAGLITVVLLLIGWYALHQRLPVPPPGTAVQPGFAAAPVSAWQPQTVAQPAPPAAQSPAPDQAPGQAPSAPSGSQPAEQPHPTEQINPPRWDPLGAAPFAWDLPEPAAAAAPAPLPPRRRSRVTPVTLGLALLATAALATINLVFGAPVSTVTGAAIVLGVVGTGLVVGAFRRTGFGLLAVAIPLAGFLVIATTAQNTLAGYANAPRGEQSFTVTDPNTLARDYLVQAGSLDLDLRGMTLDRDRTVSTKVGVGQTRIQVPETMNVQVTCAVNVGETRCPDGRITGAGAAPGAPTLTIEARGNVGEVEVSRVR
ncbi:PspC domain-containing protein [Tsukamurella serpentis]